MKTEYLPMKTLFAGMLALAVGGCATSTDDDDTGETTGGVGASGGAASGGAGGSVTTGGTATSPTGGTTATVTGGSTGLAETGGTTTVTGGSTGQPETGGTTSTGGSTDTGGQATGGRAATGGRSATGGRTGRGGANGSGGAEPSGGTADTGGRTGAGGDTASGGGPAGGESSGGSAAGGRTGTGGGATGGSTGTGTCTASKAASATGAGRGPHKVVIETNSEIKCGTIYRPEDLGGAEKYPIFVWGEGGCSQDGLSNQGAMGEIASYGYFVVADGTPGGTGACAGSQDGKQFLDYITWAIAENDKPCSAYYQSLDTTKVASDGFSCGGLMSEGISADPRLSAVGITSSGQFNANASMYDKMHAPFKVMNGGSSDMAYENGLRDYEEISSRGIPSVYFSKTSAGHGGDLGGKTGSGGDFTKVNLAWLNWQLKGDETATGKGFLVGASCTFCTDSGWDYQTNIQ
jgi:hypothetical protein